MIMTKSISRIGRNLASVLNIIHELDEIGVTFHFDKEGIYTGSDDGKRIFEVLRNM